MDSWVKITAESKPKAFKQVLILNQNGTVHLAYIDADKQWFNSQTNNELLYTPRWFMEIPRQPDII